MLSRRHRRRRFATNEVERPLRFVPILAVIIALVIVFYLGSIVLEYFGVGNSVRNAAVELTVEERGVISVSLEGSQKKQAESGIKLYPGDTAESGPGNHASLLFFDGTIMRMDQNTNVKIVESEHGAESSELSTELIAGMLWVRTPAQSSYSGAIVRTIITPAFTATIPADTEAIIFNNTVAVYSADGLGIALDIPDTEGQYYVGEGQQFILPATANKSESLYSYRQPITPDRDRSTFINESRRAVQPAGSSGATLETGTGTDVTLAVVSPTEGQAISESTVKVTGRFGVNVDKVRINGYLATLDEDKGTFSQEISLPDEDTVVITVEAVDFNGIVLEEARRTISRDRKAITAPTITAPAAGGTTYKTNSEQFELKGTVPEGTIGVLVNDYRLQLFNPGDTTWTYLASVRLENLKVGENVFNVYAIGANTLKSEPATITIIVGDGDEGVVSSASSSAGGTGGSASSEPEQVEESTLPNNAPLQPGSLTVEKPEAGTTHTTSEVEFLIEGSVPASTDSVWVNGYKLRLYSPGKTFWNYIASVELGTMKEGANTYKVNARDKDGKIIDSLTYTITYNP